METTPSGSSAQWNTLEHDRPPAVFELLGHRNQMGHDRTLDIEVTYE
jgi:hypothetical protein